MLSKKVDATLGAFWNYEGVQLQRQHKDPTIIKMDEVGVPTYQELVFVADNEKLRRRASAGRCAASCRRSRAAPRRVKADPAVGADALVKADADLDRGLQLAAIKATLPVFFPENASFPWGYMNADEWRAYGQWMLDNKLVETLPTPTSITNEFLPGRRRRLVLATIRRVRRAQAALGVATRRPDAAVIAAPPRVAAVEPPAARRAAPAVRASQAGPPS